MTIIAAVCRHELRLLLYTPLSYLFIGGFLLSLSSAIFLVADFYRTDEASIQLLLLFAPWVGMVLVPALAMGMWANEQLDKSAELTSTLPLPLASVVTGKFLAGFLVLLTTLVFTFPFPITVAFLGEPDFVRIAAGYLALALMLGFFFAIGLFAAVLTRNQVGGFVVGLGVLFVLMLMGWDVFTNLVKGTFPPEAIEIISLYSPRTWLLRMGEGSIELAAVVFFISGTGLALVGTGLMISRRSVGFNLRHPTCGAGVILLLSLLASVVPLANMPLALDWTTEKEFSLHAGTVDVIEGLPDGTTVNFYWSASESTVPVSIKSHARRIRTLLTNIAARSDGRLKIIEIDPQPDSDEELQAMTDGVQRIPMSSGDHFYLGLTVSQDRRTGYIPYFDLARDRFLEYDIALTLDGLTRQETPKIGIISPLLPSTAVVGHRQGLSFMDELKRAYDIAVIPYFKKEIPAGIKALVIIDASILRREMLYEIDQFVMRGGNLIVMIDPYVRFNRASNAVNPSPSEKTNDITDLLAKWGVRYAHEFVVGDIKAASPVSDSRENRLSFPFWMRIRKSGIGNEHAVSASLNEVFMVEPGALETTASDRVMALISTSQESGVLNRRDFNEQKPGALAAKFKSDGRRRDIAVAIRGPLKSAFEEPATASRAGSLSNIHLSQSIGSPNVFVIADVDWVFDPFSLQRVNVSGRTVVRPLNDNLTFLLNMTEYATGKETLTGIRSRGQLQRPFTRVLHLFEQAQARYREEETALARKVTRLEERLRTVVRSTGKMSPGNLPKALRADIKTFRQELIAARARLRDMRRLIRSEMESLGQRIALINLASGPVLILLLWCGVNLLRRRRARQRGAL